MFTRYFGFNIKNNIYFKWYVKDAKENVISVFILFFVYISLLFYIDYIYDCSISNCFERWEKTTYYYNCNKEESKQNYKNVIKRIKNKKGVRKVGYELYTNNANIDGEGVLFVYVSDYACKIKYKLNQGRWFGKEDINKKKVIIGGNIVAKYNCGKQINVKGDYGCEKYEVIGKLKKNYFNMLNFNGQGANFYDILGEFENIVLTNDKQTIKKYNLQCYNMAYYICLKNKNEIDNKISFKELQKNTTKMFKDIYLGILPVVISLFIYCFVSVFFEIIMNFYTEKENIYCLKRCGINNGRIYILLLEKSVVNNTLAFLLAVVLWWSNNKINLDRTICYFWTFLIINIGITLIVWVYLLKRINCLHEGV